MNAKSQDFIHRLAEKYSSRATSQLFKIKMRTRAIEHHATLIISLERLCVGN